MTPSRQIVERWEKAGHILLHAGEMTGKELRAVKAVVAAIKRELLAAAPASPSLASADTGGWRTMESAPKDGTQVDLWCRAPGLSAGQGRVVDCWFFSGHWWRYDEQHGDGDCKSKVHNICHWRVLPPPPTDGGATAERTEPSTPAGKQ